MFCVSIGMAQKGPDSKEGPIPLQWRKFRLVFHLTRWDMSESRVETLEKAVGVSIIWTGVLTSL